ncbi:MAG: hypothetical protein ACWA44_04205 [Thiotrichales bacterium]
MKIKVLLSLIAISAMLSGCNTAQGFGKDVENLGLLLQGKKQDEMKTPSSNESTVKKSEIIEETYVDQYGNPIQPQDAAVQSYPYTQAPAEGGSGYIEPAPVMPANP